MTRPALFLSIVAIGLFSTGCVGLSTNPSKAGQTLSEWIPLGTSQDAAVKALKEHGFNNTELIHTSPGESLLIGSRASLFHLWSVNIPVKDGKVVTNIVSTVGIYHGSWHM
jgi:hypothetical protein